MPLFALISGYLYAHSICRYKTMLLLRKRFRSLLLPCIAWGVLSTVVIIVVQFANGNLVTAQTLVSTVIKKVLYTDYWFLKAMFICSVSVLIVHKYLKGHWLAYMVLCLSTLLWSREATTAYVLPFFVIGFMYGLRRSCIHIHPKIALLFSVVYCLAMMVFSKDCYVYTTGINILAAEEPLKQLLIDLYRFGVGMVGSIGFAGLLEIAQNRLSKKSFITDVGQNTGMIYILTTPFFLLMERSLAQTGFSLGLTVPMNLFVDILLLVLSLLLVWACIQLNQLIQKNRFVWRVFFGK